MEYVVRWCEDNISRVVFEGRVDLCVAIAVVINSEISINKKIAR